ncbi:MAG: hypothetical protein ACYTG3_08700 [Planctomycetota bacterium]
MTERTLLHRHWVHSHEEDTERERVYRPATFPFPPSRGRTGFDLKPDNRCAGFGIAPADGVEEYAATWDLDDDDRLTIYDDRRRPVHVLQLVSVDDDRLVVRR